MSPSEENFSKKTYSEVICRNLQNKSCSVLWPAAGRSGEYASRWILQWPQLHVQKSKLLTFEEKKYPELNKIWALTKWEWKCDRIYNTASVQFSTGGAATRSERSRANFWLNSLFTRPHLPSWTESITPVCSEWFFQGLDDIMMWWCHGCCLPCGIKREWKSEMYHIFENGL